MSFQTPQTPGVIQPRIKIVGGKQDINSKGRSFRAQEAININYNQQIMSRQSWSAQEDQAITKLVKQHGIEDWTKIALKLRDYLGKHKRTGKQCRERWYNHLSPSVCKNPWTQKEEQLLFVCHKNYGNRWKDISKMFSGRTDNDIKNHFYSTLRRSLRRLNKTVGEKNSTTQMREVKPSVLSTIMHYIYEQEQHAQTQLIQSLKDLPLLIFEFASFKPIKLNIKNTNIQQIRQKTNQIFSLIARFNEEYETNKAFRRNLKSEKLRKKQSNHDYESNERAQGEIKIQERSDSYQQEEPVVNNNAPAVNEIQQHNIKVEIKDEYFDQNIDMKPLNKTEFSLEHDQGERYNHENVTHLTIFHQFDTSPKQSLKEPFPNQPPSIRGFSLEADEINDLHFHEPQQPSRLNMDENEYVRFNHEMEGQKDRYHHVELIDEVIQTHFAA